MAEKSNTNSMQAICFSKYGKIDQLKKTTISYPEGFDTTNNVLIKVRAAAVNPVDKALLSGDLKMVRPVADFPHVICYDVAGIVEQADSEGKFSVGQSVFARIFGDADDGKKTPWYRGAMAEYCVVNSSNLVLMPENLTFVEAASIPLVGMTSLQVLNNLGLKEGESIFISGGAGGVGTMAIQLAKNVFKAGNVVTTASKGEKEELCKTIGADAVIDYQTSNFVEIYGRDTSEKFDYCFDTTGESDKMSSIVKPGGKIVTIAGMPTLEEIRRIGGSAWILKLFIKRKEKRKEYLVARSVNVDWNYLFLSPSNEDLTDLAKYLENGSIKPVIDGVWDFNSEDTNDGWIGAFQRSFSGRSKGKCVVKFTD
tara:strand:- start:110 stop:1213 length:1104 start_codon:yes stop_codon:yes gene_type:complete